MSQGSGPIGWMVPICVCLCTVTFLKQVCSPGTFWLGTCRFQKLSCHLEHSCFKRCIWPVSLRMHFIESGNFLSPLLSLRQPPSFRFMIVLWSFISLPQTLPLPPPLSPAVSPIMSVSVIFRQRLTTALQAMHYSQMHTSRFYTAFRHLQP